MATPHDHHADPHEPHVLPLRTYFVVYVVLMLLFVATVAVTAVDLGPLNVVVALTIAVAKALLIILYFMHVRYSGRLTKIFVAASFVWLLILLGLALTDYLTRTWVSVV